MSGTPMLLDHWGILHIARTVRDGQPTSYVLAAKLLAKYLLDHQLALPGQFCGHCAAFNGAGKEVRETCLACDSPLRDGSMSTCAECHHPFVEHAMGHGPCIALCDGDCANGIVEHVAACCQCPCYRPMKG